MKKFIGYVVIATISCIIGFLGAGNGPASAQDTTLPDKEPSTITVEDANQVQDQFLYMEDLDSIPDGGELSTTAKVVLGLFGVIFVFGGLAVFTVVRVRKDEGDELELQMKEFAAWDGDLTVADILAAEQAIAPHHLEPPANQSDEVEARPTFSELLGQAMAQPPEAI